MTDPSGMPPVLEVEDLAVHFPITSPWGRRVGAVEAVRGVDFDLSPGETVGLVGESGCGKSTLARAVVRLVPATHGRVRVAGREWTGAPERKLRPWRADAQMVFQDPFSSLNPRMRVGEILGEPLRVHGRGDRGARRREVRELLRQVGLHADDAAKYPHEFSGGQRQRIGIARAIALRPKVLLADEAVSALDVSVQAQVLNLLLDLQAEHRFAMLFISHDLRVVEQVSDRVLVMYLGRIVEEGTPAEIFGSPRHPYTRALVDAVPLPDPERQREHIKLAGEPPSPSDPPSGCAFRLRCPRASEICAGEIPQLEPVAGSPGHRYACYHPLSSDDSA